MQKKLIALAIAGLATSAAFAQSNVTIYGRVDGGFVSRSGSSGAVQVNGTNNTIESGIGGGSRLGFRGTEDLGNGLKALFELETGLNIDNSAGSAAGVNSYSLAARHAYVGVTGNFGTALLGRLDGVRYGIAGKYDPFALGTVGQFASLQVHQTRADNAVAYVSPTFSGFNVLAAYSNNLTGNEGFNNAAISAPATPFAQNTIPGGASPNQKANTGRATLWAISPAYNNGPISLTYDHEEAKFQEFSDAKIKIDVLGGSYDFGFVKLMAYYERVKADNGVNVVLAPPTAAAGAAALPTPVWDQRSYALGATAPVLGGKGLIKASWAKVDDKLDNVASVTSTAAAGGVAGGLSNGDCTKASIGFQYNLSKRTNVYTDFAKINNKGNGACTIAFSGATGSLDQGGAGYGVRGFDLGVAHTF